MLSQFPDQESLPDQPFRHKLSLVALQHKTQVHNMHYLLYLQTIFLVFLCCVHLASSFNLFLGQTCNDAPTVTCTNIDYNTCCWYGTDDDWSFGAATHDQVDDDEFYDTLWTVFNYNNKVDPPNPCGIQYMQSVASEYTCFESKWNTIAGASMLLDEKLQGRSTGNESGTPDDGYAQSKITAYAKADSYAFMDGDVVRSVRIDSPEGVYFSRLVGNTTKERQDYVRQNQHAEHPVGV